MATTQESANTKDAEVNPAASEAPAATAPDDRPGTTVGVLGVDWKMIAALIEERDGYETAGNTERIKAVDKSFAAYGTTYAKAKKALADRAKAEAEALGRPVGEADRNQKMIEALLEEREGYERVGKKDRVAAVDESLKALGTTYQKAAKERSQRQDRQAAPQAPQRSGQQQTR